MVTKFTFNVIMFIIQTVTMYLVNSDEYVSCSEGGTD
jgi:hypothetical protein